MAVQRRLAIRLIAAYESKDLAVPKALSKFQPGRSKKNVVPGDFLVSTVKDDTSALSKQGIEIVADSDLLGKFFKASGDEAFSIFAENSPKRAHDEASPRREVRREFASYIVDFVDRRRREIMRHAI